MAQERQTIAIVGGTGVLGGCIARHFGNKLRFHVRTISRQPHSMTADALRKDVAGVEIVHGDLDDVQALYSLFRSAHIIYLSTFYWKIRSDPRVAEEASIKCTDIDEVAMKHEERHYRNAFDALARIVQEQKAQGPTRLKRVIINTLPNPQTISGGKYRRAYHFQSRARGTALLQGGAKSVNPGYQEVLDLASYIYVGVYLQSFFNSKLISVRGKPIIGPDKQDDGTYLFKQVSSPPFKEIPFVRPNRDLGRLVEALSLNAPSGTHLLGGQPLTLEDFVSCWGHTLQVPVSWQAVAIDDIMEEFPDALREFLGGVLESSAFVTEYGFDGGIGAKWPSELGVDDDELVDMSQWIKETDWSDWLEPERSNQLSRVSQKE